MRFKEAFPDCKVSERTAQFYINQREEQLRQRTLRAAIKAEGGKVISLEHDGVVAAGASDLLAKVQSRLEFKIDLKAYPDEEELLAMCRARWAGWELKSDEPAVELELARIRVEHLVATNRFRCHESFYHKDNVVVSSRGAVEFAIFDQARCIWKECNKVKLEGLVTEAFHEIRSFTTTPSLNKNYACEVRVQTRLEALEDHNQKTNALNEVRQFICRDLPPADNTPGTLLFKRGSCLRFQTGEVFRPTPESHYTRHCCVEYKPFAAPQEWKDKFLCVVRELEAFWVKHDTTEATGTDVDQLGRADLRACLDELRDSGHFPFISAIYNLDGDWDRTLYILKWMIRIVSGVTSFNEALFLWGLGLSGKDTIVNFLTGLLGYDTDDGYVGQLKASYFNASKHDEGSEGATGFLAALKDARLCVVSERKGDEAFDGDKLKPLTEQEGARIPARKLFGHPQAFSMTAAIVALSNHQLDLGADPDDGLVRRIRVDRMPRKFVPKEKLSEDSPSNRREQDASIKIKAKTGEHAPEMIFVLQALYQSLFIRPGTNIEPTPKEVQAESSEVCAGSRASLSSSDILRA